MSKRSLLHVIVVLTMSAGSLLAVGNAAAAGIQTTLTSNVMNAIGTGNSTIALFVNGAPLPLVEGQVVSLGLGDVLRAELSATALYEGSLASFSRVLNMNFVLDAGTDAAMVETAFSGQVDSTLDVAQGSTYSEVVCDFTVAGCSAPGLPLSTAFTSNVISSTLSIQPNQKTINNVTTPTGRTGGVETIDLLTQLSLARGLNPPAGSVSLGVTALAISEAQATTSGVLELTVTQVTAVPIPAAGWLLGTALVFTGSRKLLGRESPKRRQVTPQLP
jgi:hypothetical protein